MFCDLYCAYEREGKMKSDLKKLALLLVRNLDNTVHVAATHKKCDEQIRVSLPCPDE